MDRFPIMRRTYAFLCNAHPHSLTYDEMTSGLMAVDEANRASRGIDELQDSARWLRSLGLIEDDGRKPLRFHAKKPFLARPIMD